MFSSCNSKFFAVRHIHYSVNPSNAYFHTGAVVPSSDHCHLVIIAALIVETVAPSGDHYCIETVPPSSDHY